VSDLADLPPRERRPGRPPQRLPKVVGVLVVLVVLAVLVATAAYGVARVRSHFSSAPDYTGSGTGSAVVQVNPGDTASDVAVTLVAKDVVKSAAAFREAAAADPDSRSLQPGYYQLRQRMSAAAALSLLLDPAARVRGRVTIPEGSTVNQTLALIAKNTEVRLADLQQAVAAPAALGLPAYARGRLEGFLFPATYEVEPGTSATEVLQMMVRRYTEAAEAAGLVAGARALGLTPYDVIITASLIERESRLVDEYPKVARVVYNRLAANMTLGIDAAILYGLGRTSGGLTQSDLSKDTPYNNRLHTGLPPTAIASPGEVALEAALHPEQGDWLYYVLADKNGRQLFTADYAVFLRQKAKSQAEGVF
jgi:UPF0755 protein